MFSHELLVVCANLCLELLNSCLHPEDLLVQSSLLSLEISNLLVEPHGLGSLILIMSLDLLIYSMQLVDQGFASILHLHCQH